MTEGYTLKLLIERLDDLKKEINEIRIIHSKKPLIEIISIESHYHTVITDVQKSIEKLTKEEKLPSMSV